MLSAAACALATGLSAAAQTPSDVSVGEARTFDIPAQALADALPLFGRQAGLQVSVRSDLVRGLSTAGVRGDLHTSEALDRLLAGTGLTGRIVDGTVVLQSAPDAGDGAILLGPVRVGGAASDPNSSKGVYTLPASSSASLLDLEIKETPQVVNVITRQRIEDQNLNQVADVMAQAPGVTVQQQGVPGMGQVDFYSRGWSVTNVMFDGIATSGSGNGDFVLWSALDTALFERVEFVQGSTGLATGAGDPSASVNFVRKRPTKEKYAEARASLGSWDRMRAEIDLSGPLNESGSIRGRFVAAYHEGGTWQDRVHFDTPTLYGIVEADLNDDVLLAAGVVWTNIGVDDAAPFGLDSYYTVSEGRLRSARAFVGRSFNPATQWSYADVELLNPFIELKWQIADDLLFNARYLYADVSQDRMTGVIGQSRYEPDIDEAGFTWGRLQHWGETHNVDVSLSGSFGAFGQKHDFVVGFSGYKGELTNGIVTTDSGMPKNGVLGWDVLAISQWNDGNVPIPGGLNPEYLPFGPPPGVINFLGTHDPLNFNIRQWLRENTDLDVPDDVTTQEQYGFYASLHLRPTDDLSIILGGRYNYWSRSYDAYALDVMQLLTGNYALNYDPTRSWDMKVDGEFTPYAGIVYDITDEISAFVSYTGINKANIRWTGGFGGFAFYKPNGDLLDPITGNSWEAGIKAGLFNNSLNVQLTGFYMEQGNLPGEFDCSLPTVWDPYSGTNRCPVVKTVDGAIMQGVEVNLAGQVTERLNLMASYTWLNVSGGWSGLSDDCLSGHGRAFACPEHTVKVFGTYQATDALTIGGGLNWKSRTGFSSGIALGNTPEEIAATLAAISQKSYAVVDLMARYQLTEDATLSVYVQNVFDEEYLTAQGTFSGYYGAPRNFMMTLGYRF